MTHAIDFSNPVYWLLGAAMAGAVILLAVGVASTVAFDRKYSTREAARAYRRSQLYTQRPFTGFERFFFTVFIITILLLFAYLVAGVITGTHLI